MKTVALFNTGVCAVIVMYPKTLSAVQNIDWGNMS